MVFFNWLELIKIILLYYIIKDIFVVNYPTPTGSISDNWCK